MKFSGLVEIWQGEGEFDNIKKRAGIKKTKEHC